MAILNREEELALARAYRGTRARDLEHRLVSANLGLVHRIARDYVRDPQLLADVVQEGCLGLMIAVRRFDPERGVRLGTYAGWWIRAHVLKFVRESGSLVRCDSRQARSEFLAGRGTPRDIRLDAPVEPGSERSGIDALAAPEDGRPDRLFEKNDMAARRAATIRRFEGSLEERERTIFHARWHAEEQPTLRLVGRSVALSKERARQIETVLLRRLRHDLQAAGVAA